MSLANPTVFPHNAGRHLMALWFGVVQRESGYMSEQVPDPQATVGRVRVVLRWWPIVLAPLTIAVVYTIRAVPLDAEVFGIKRFGLQLMRWTCKEYQEDVALVLMPLAVLLSAVRLLKAWLERHRPGADAGRVRLFLIWTVFTAVLLCREIHFAGTSTGVYVAAALIAAWCYVWRDSLKRHVWRTAKGRWVIIAGWSYCVALIIQRRALRFLPDEKLWHGWMEEMSENVAHLMLIIATLI